MMAYSYKGGYGKANIKEVEDLIDKYLPVGSIDKITIKDLLYDYECLRRIIDGNQFVFRHEDGSEVRRIKLY